MLSFILFADDSNVFIKGKCVKELEQSLNIEMEKIIEWLQVNRLSLNIKKTHHMVFTPKFSKNTPEAKIKINNVSLTQVYECKFLGVQMDSRFTWEKHAAYMGKKIAKSVGIISKARKSLNQKSTLSLYYAFIYPLLLYCNLSWGNATQAITWCIFKLQKRALRLICNINRRESTTSYFKKLGILRLPELYKYSSAIFLFKFMNEELPPIFNGFFQRNSDVHARVTRGGNILQSPMTDCRTGETFIRKSGVLLWNEMSESISPNTSISIFKKCVKQYLIDLY